LDYYERKVSNIFFIIYPFASIFRKYDNILTNKTHMLHIIIKNQMHAPAKNKISYYNTIVNSVFLCKFALIIRKGKKLLYGNSFKGPHQGHS